MRNILKTIALLATMIMALTGVVALSTNTGKPKVPSARQITDVDWNADNSLSDSLSSKDSEDLRMRELLLPPPSIHDNN